MHSDSHAQSTIYRSLNRIRSAEPDPFSQRELLLPFLQTVQEELGHVPEEAIAAAAAEFGVPENEVYGAASFHPELRLEPVGRFVVQVCDSTPCELGGCGELVAQLEEELGIPAGTTSSDGLFTLERVGCLGVCHACPAVRINDRTFHALTPPALSDLVDRLRKRKTLETLWQTYVPEHAEATPRVRVHGTAPVLTGEGEAAGEGAFERAMAMAPEVLVETVVASGLRGRGGAGFPTGVKWQAVAEAEGDTKFLVVNADESEIGTFKDRYLLTRHPSLVLRGALIAARAVGAKRVYVFLRSAYRGLIPKLAKEFEQLHRSGRPCGAELTFRESPGGYLCGEETALIQALEGRRGESRYRPPYPTTRGLFDQPTVVNNVETLANVPLVFAEGVARAGSTGGFGTKLFCVSGDIAEPGIVEAPFGVSLGELLETCGGLANGAELGFSILGGAGGRVLQPDDRALPLTFDTGAGNGSVIVCNGDRSLPEALRSVLRFFARESCGACLPCREGVAELHAALQPENTDAYSTDRLAKLCRSIRLTSRCGLGQTAPRLLEDALRSHAL